jgi:hypothetical protein
MPTESKRLAKRAFSSTVCSSFAEFVEHYHRERNHQGLENALIEGAPVCAQVGGIRRHQRLGGLLNYYARAA